MVFFKRGFSNLAKGGWRGELERGWGRVGEGLGPHWGKVGEGVSWVFFLPHLPVGPALGNFLGARKRKAMTPQKLWTLLFFSPRARERHMNFEHINIGVK